MDIFQKGTWKLTEEYKKTWELTPLNCVPQLFRAILAIVSGSGTEHFYFWADRQFQWLKDDLPKAAGVVADLGKDRVHQAEYTSIENGKVTFGDIKGFGGKWDNPPNLSDTERKIRLEDGSVYIAGYPESGTLPEGFMIVDAKKNNKQIEKGTYICAIDQKPPKLYFFKNVGNQYFYYSLQKVPGTGKTGQYFTNGTLDITQEASEETINIFGLKDAQGFIGVISTCVLPTLIHRSGKFYELQFNEIKQFNGVMAQGTYAIAGRKFYYYRGGNSYQVFNLIDYKE